MDAINEASLKPIFLLDDSPAHRRLIRRALQKAGLPHPVIEFSSMQEALDMLLRAPSSTPAAAIVDLNLKDGRGTAFVARIRAHPTIKTIPVIVLSTSTLISDIRDSYDHGADCYLIKSDEAMSSGVARGLRFLLRWDLTNP